MMERLLLDVLNAMMGSCLLSNWMTLICLDRLLTGTKTQLNQEEETDMRSFLFV